MVIKVLVTFITSDKGDNGQRSILYIYQLASHSLRELGASSVSNHSSDQLVLLRHLHYCEPFGFSESLPYGTYLHWTLSECGSDRFVTGLQVSASCLLYVRFGQEDNIETGGILAEGSLDWDVQNGTLPPHVISLTIQSLRVTITSC